MSSMIRRLIATFATAVLVTLSASGPTFGFCAGDCNHDGTVAINELIMGVNIAAGRMAVDQCSYLDLNDDGEISIDELIGAVTISLDGCYPLRPFSTVQQVFTQSCALSSCHSALGRKGNMVLDNEDLSFQSLVNAEPDNAEARADGLDARQARRRREQLPDPQAARRRPGGRDAAGRAAAAGGHHPHHRGLDPARRAHHRAGLLADRQRRRQPRHPAGQLQSSLQRRPDHHRRFRVEAGRPLDPPPAGEGIQFHVPPRPVMPGTEWETCYAFHPDPSRQLPSHGSSRDRSIG